MNIVITVEPDEGGMAELVITSGTYVYRRPVQLESDDSREIITQLYDELIVQDLLSGLLGEIL